MTWVRFDDVFPRHRKIRELRRDVVAKWLHVVAICHCGEHLTDGRVDELALEQIINDAQIPASAARRSVPKLVDVGLWQEVEGGYLIRDFLDYNPPAAVVKEQREKARERMKTLRRSREQTANVRGTFVTPSPTPTPKEQDQVLLARETVDRSLRSVQ